VVCAIPRAARENKRQALQPIFASSLHFANLRQKPSFISSEMKRTILTDVTVFLVLVFLCTAKPFAQSPGQQAGTQVNPFSFLTIIKLDEVGSKEDMDKVKEVLRGFGYKVHSHKINFERKEVLIRMRQMVSNDSLITAFKAAGYTAWHDDKEMIQVSDAAYHGDKK